MVIYFFGLVSYHFVAFSWTNLLTRYPMSDHGFCCFIFQNIYLTNILRTGQNFTEIFYRREETTSPKGNPGRPISATRHLATALGLAAGRSRVGRLGSSLVASFAHKTPSFLKQKQWKIFPQNRDRAAAIVETWLEGFWSSFLAPCQRGKPSWEGSTIGTSTMMRE